MGGGAEGTGCEVQDALQGNVVSEVRASLGWRRPVRPDPAHVLPECLGRLEGRQRPALGKLTRPVLALAHLGRSPIAPRIQPQVLGIHSFSISRGIRAVRQAFGRRQTEPGLPLRRRVARMARQARAGTPGWSRITAAPLSPAAAAGRERFSAPARSSDAHLEPVENLEDPVRDVADGNDLEPHGRQHCGHEFMLGHLALHRSLVALLRPAASAAGWPRRRR